MRRRDEQEAADLRRTELLARDLAAVGRAPAGPEQAAEPERPAEPEGSGPVAIPLPGRHSRGRPDAGGRLTGWQDLIGRIGWWPESRPESRHGHLVVVAVAVAVAMAITAWIVISSAPRAVPAPVARTTTVVPTVAPTASSVSSPAGAPAPTAVVVDVTGKVRHPGIATLPAGSRVIDALRRAGGARPGADLSSLNLARPLTDGEQIVVGKPASAAAASGAGASSGSGADPSVRISLNSATLEQLDTLPGVGPVTAQKILDWRTEHGRFSTVDELLEVDGIGTKTMADIAPHVML